MYKLSSPFIKKTGLVIISILSLVLNVRSQTLTLAVAANFRDPMNEIIQAFRTENNDILVRSVYGSSGSLYQQISHHAPFDIFFSANTKYPEELLKENIACDTPGFMLWVSLYCGAKIGMLGTGWRC